MLATANAEAIKAKRARRRFVGRNSPEAFAPINPVVGTDVDFAHIARLEGDRWLRDHVPLKNRTRAQVAASAFRNQATQGQFTEAVTTLHGYSVYRGRIGQEADLLEARMPPPSPKPKAPGAKP